MIPALPGLDNFAGTVFHSATWDHGRDLAGRRVAVIGTGASAIQFVPRIQPRVGQLHLFQRTPPWIIPRRDRAITPAPGRLPWHDDARLPEPVRAHRPEHRTGAQLPGLHDRGADPLRDRRGDVRPPPGRGSGSGPAGGRDRLRPRVLQDKMRRTVWVTGGCRSWYLNDAGRNVSLWPDSTWAFAWQTRRFDLSSYEVLLPHPQ